jgi:hypothetical protein
MDVALYLVRSPFTGCLPIQDFIHIPRYFSRIRTSFISNGISLDSGLHSRVKVFLPLLDFVLSLWGFSPGFSYRSEPMVVLFTTDFTQDQWGVTRHLIQSLSRGFLFIV